MFFIFYHIGKNRIMNLSELIPGQRYLFHYKTVSNDNIKTFRANFINVKHGINVSTIKVNNYA